MARIPRPTGDVQAFASSSQGQERTIFGGTTQDDALSTNLNTDWLRGWAAGVNDAGFPPMQFFNALGYTATQMTAYLFQNGISEWDNLQEYNDGSTVQFNGVIYVSNADDNIGNQPSTSSEWVSLLDQRGGTISGNLELLGNVEIQTSERGNLRLKRANSNTIGDDIVDIIIDDIGLIFLSDNDNDRDDGQFLFQNVVDGTPNTIMSINSTGSTINTTLNVQRRGNI